MRFVVPPEIKDITVKQFLRKYCDVSARTLTKLKHTENGITSDGVLIRSIDILHGGDEVVLSLPKDDVYIKANPLSVEVAYEDDYVIIFNKPSGMTVHPVHEYRENTLANFAAYHMGEMGESYAFRPVSRLDKDTSGLVLCAKDRYTAAFLPQNNKKLYTALCHGRTEETGTIDSPIRIKEGYTIQRETGVDGKYAVTHFKAIKHYGDEFTLLAVRIETGRTHQIRTHFSSIGHPLAGDDMYGGSREHFGRQCLHCSELRFIHPVTREELEVRSDIDFFDEYIE